MATAYLIRRALVLVGTAGALGLVVSSGLADLMSSANASRAGLARQWAPNDARLTAAAASARMLRIDDPQARNAARDLAMKALRRDVTNVQAIAVLGTVATASGRVDEARKFMNASASLSKRDLATRLWFIEEAVGREDVAGALKHFDIALRTSARSADILYPVLSQALTDDALVAPIAKLLKTGPAWSGSFLYSAINSGAGLENIARVYISLDPRPQHAGQDLGKLLIDTMIAHSKFAAARNLNAALTPGVRPGNLINDPGFQTAAGYAPFDWSLAAETSLEIARDRDAMGSGLSVGGSAFDAIVASQLLALTPGDYEFSGSLGNAEDGADLSAVWTMECAGQPAATGRMVLPATGAVSRVRWSVPSGCAAQWLRVRIEGGDGISRKRVLIRPVSLRRL